MDNTINILVVDDEEAIREFFERLLKMKGFGAKVAKGGKEALEIVANENIHVIIIDIFMPEMDGFELLDQIKKNYPKIATIMMTGMGDAAMIRKATLQCADEYITMPFKREDLSIIIFLFICKIMPKESAAI
ncbi:MAG: response regulator [candidate division Zixibacteria bacterium]|nr:response regulator [candidate division Zixibacteria bacterium]